jgi:hypothetical protein
MPEEELQVVNLDVPRVVTTALGVLPKVRKFEARIRALPEFDNRCFDELEDRTLALLQAHAAFLAAGKPEEPIPELVERALGLRSRVMASLRSLTLHGVIPRELDSYAAPKRGHLGLTEHLGMLVVILREHWAAAEGKSPLSLQDLGELEELQARLLKALGVRRVRAKRVSRATSLRLRAFTLLVQAYSEVRHAICYLRRRDGDADKIIPSLYEKRTPRRKRARQPDGRASPTPERLIPGARSADHF